MLLEQLAERANQKPGYNWEAYYQWQFSEQAGRKVTGSTFWECKKCLTIDQAYLPRVTESVAAVN